jgi:hypothetical protein
MAIYDQIEWREFPVVKLDFLTLDKADLGVDLVRQVRNCNFRVGVFTFVACSRS